MAQLIITIPDNIAARVNQAFSNAHGYLTTINGSPNPESRAQFNQRIIRELIKNTVLSWEADQAAATTRNTANNEITLS